MNAFTESLKRLYKDSKVTLVKLDELKTRNKVTSEEYNYIINIT